MSIGQSATFSFITSATLGSAARRFALPDLAALTRYPRILAVYDDDPAGDQARQYLSSFAPLPTLGEGLGVRDSR